jgi:site-specific DNA-cytosine methylase
MNVLVACEFSAIVRDAFLNKGHNAYSCDLLPTEGNSNNHFQCDIRDLSIKNWDLLIAHPPCTYLASSGARWWKDRQVEQQDAINFVKYLANLHINKIAIENPIGILSTVWQKPTQIVQPWQFGHGETKATCLWLLNLPKLIPTKIVDGREQRVHLLPPGPDRWKERSRTYKGIAEAMALQWGRM